MPVRRMHNSPPASAILRLAQEYKIAPEIAPEVATMLGDFFPTDSRDALGRWLRQIARLGSESSLLTESAAIAPFEAALSGGTVVRLHVRAAANNGATRDETRRKLVRGLEHTVAFGVITNQASLQVTLQPGTSSADAGQFDVHPGHLRCNWQEVSSL